jgi:ferrous iron transport protein B
VATIRAWFEEAVAAEGLAEGDVELTVLRQQRDMALARLKGEDPALFAVALRYVDDTFLPYRRELRSVAAAKQADVMSYSVAGRLGHAVAPLLRPLGFDWRIGTALIGALAAKEMFVAQLGIVFAVGDGGQESTVLRDKLRETYSPLVGFCILLFCLITAPCVATIAVTRRETGQWRWAWLQLGGLTVLAYVVTLIVYQGGRLLGIGL